MWDIIEKWNIFKQQEIIDHFGKYNQTGIGR